MNGTLIGVVIGIYGEVLASGVVPPSGDFIITEDVGSFVVSENGVDFLIQE